jgi:hypothetical protein
MRSKSEVIIDDALYARGIEADYERKFEGADGTVKYPDFTIEDSASGIVYLWEHLGMLGDPAYRRRWEAKLVWYRVNGVLPREEGHGERATLIVTEDSRAGGLSSKQIHDLIEDVWG